ncbi:hypothetical protein RvY_16508 [Ramazzottius varieornatus]|uniref:Uncharacterized protein n=1 Tax=Ramazzottius varieornatus TaxID=947166 RepID=A0A1D1VYQ3_RAMVA|nr:hypothetical protein RvY_16508 [Ramazzottius varieornatus]
MFPAFAEPGRVYAASCDVKICKQKIRPGKSSIRGYSQSNPSCNFHLNLNIDGVTFHGPFQCEIPGIVEIDLMRTKVLSKRQSRYR